jgi:FimV-like protein
MNIALYYSSYILACIGFLALMQTIYHSIPSTKLYQLEDGEYDFLQDTSSLQSRLDLAQAYVEMNQIQNAKDILNELINSSDVNIREKAIQALDNI